LTPSWPVSETSSCLTMYRACAEGVYSADTARTSVRLMCTTPRGHSQSLIRSVSSCWLMGCSLSVVSWRTGKQTNRRGADSVRHRLEYTECVRPKAREVEAWLGQICGQRCAFSCRDVVGTIYARRAEWDSLVTRYKGGLRPNAPSWGRCFSHAVFLCAVFRALGYGADHTLVAITCHDGEPFEKALHATVVLCDDGGWYCVDVTKPSPEEAILPIANLEDLSRTNPYVCVFNDQSWQVAEGCET